MRPIDEESRIALDGSRPADTLIVWAWRDGSLVVPEPLQVIGAGWDEDAGDAVKIGQNISLTVADPDGSLGAWRLDDPLGVAGTLLQVIYKIGGARALNAAWFRITDNTPDELVDWRVINEYGYEEPDGDLEPHTRRVPVITSVVKIDAVDLTIGPDRDKLENPESPGAGATIISEFKRLTHDYFPTVVDPGVTDRTVSRQLVFDRERLEAGQDLLGRISARYRMGGDGECRVYPLGTAPVWRVEPGYGLVSVKRRQSLDGLYNRWVVEGKESENGQPVRAAVSIETGPLRFGGPHGRAQSFYSSEMIETYSQAVAYATRLRDEFLSSLAVVLTVETAPRPDLQAGDRIEVGCPVVAGYVAYLPGEITSIRRSFTTVPGSTVLTVSCSYADVVNALNRTDWAQHLTGNKPALTWDRMPSTWGSAPAITWDNLP